MYKKRRIFCGLLVEYCFYLWDLLNLDKETPQSFKKYYRWWIRDFQKFAKLMQYSNYSKKEIKQQELLYTQLFDRYQKIHRKLEKLDNFENINNKIHKEFVINFRNSEHWINTGEFVDSDKLMKWLDNNILTQKFNSRVENIILI